METRNRKDIRDKTYESMVRLYQLILKNETDISEPAKITFSNIKNYIKTQIINYASETKLHAEETILKALCNAYKIIQKNNWLENKANLETLTQIKTEFDILIIILSTPLSPEEEAEKLFKTAKKFTKQGNIIESQNYYQQAFLAYKKLSQNNDKNDYVHYKLGLLYEGGLGIERNIDTAIQHYKKVKKEDWFEEEERQENSNIEKENLQKLHAATEHISTINEENIRTIHQKKLNTLALINKADRIFTPEQNNILRNYIKAKNKLADIFIHKKDYKLAREILRVGVLHNNIESIYLFGKTHYLLNEMAQGNRYYDEAIRLLNEKSSKLKKHKYFNIKYNILYERAQTYESMKNYESAIHHYTVVMYENNSFSELAYMQLSRLSFKNALESKIDLCKQGLSRGFTEAMLDLAELFIENRDQVDKIPYLTSDLYKELLSKLEAEETKNLDAENNGKVAYVLGKLYEFYKNPPELEKTADYYYKAASAYPIAMYHAARFCDRKDLPRTLPKNSKKEIIALYNKAYEFHIEFLKNRDEKNCNYQTIVYMHFNLGLMLENKNDLPTALYHYSFAATAGYPPAITKVKELRQKVSGELQIGSTDVKNITKKKKRKSSNTVKKDDDPPHPTLPYIPSISEEISTAFDDLSSELYKENLDEKNIYSKLENIKKFNLEKNNNDIVIQAKCAWVQASLNYHKLLREKSANTVLAEKCRIAYQQALDFSISHLSSLEKNTPLYDNLKAIKLAIKYEFNETKLNPEPEKKPAEASKKTSSHGKKITKPSSSKKESKQEIPIHSVTEFPALGTEVVPEVSTTVSTEKLYPKAPRVATRLEINFLISDHARFILDTFRKEAKTSGFLVGGMVRDNYLKHLDPEFQKEVRDEDIVTNLQPDEIVSLFKKNGQIKDQFKDKIKDAEKISRQFPIARITFHDGTTIEVATFRKNTTNSYLIKKDATGVIRANKAYSAMGDEYERRDFTINALYYNPDEIWKDQKGRGVILDYGTGFEDLKNKVLRFAHENPEQAIEDDPFRIFRAFRFAAELNFTIEEKSLAAIQSQAYRLENMSTSDLMRFYKVELPKILHSTKAKEIFTHMTKFGILEKITKQLKIYYDTLALPADKEKLSASTRNIFPDFIPKMSSSSVFFTPSFKPATTEPTPASKISNPSPG